MNAEQECANFEAWWREEMSPKITGDGPLLRKISWDVWQARAVLQSQDREDAQPKLKVVIHSFAESNGKRNWTALLLREQQWDGLPGNCGGITVGYGEYWNRVAYEAERTKYLLGLRETEPCILDYGDDIETPEQWKGEAIDHARRNEGGKK